MNRRSFLRAGAAASPGALLARAESAAMPSDTPCVTPPPDSLTNSAGTEYFFLGNGRITAALQSVTARENGTHAGMVLFSPQHFTHKSASLLFSPRSGLHNSVLRLSVAGNTYSPEPGKSAITWEYPDGVPTVRMEWQAGDCALIERLFCAREDPVIVRQVTVRNLGDAPVAATVILPFQPNATFFDEFTTADGGARLAAAGYHVLELSTPMPVEQGDRELRIPLGALPPGREATATILLALDPSGPGRALQPLQQLTADAAAYWGDTHAMHTGDTRLDHLFRVSRSGIRAAVARSGKMDGGLLQYNAEWVRDASMVASGAVLAGMPELGRSMLERLLTRSVDDAGRTLESGRHRPPEIIELDQNGELLHALYTHWVWTGDDSLLRRHWPRIRAVADYVLRPEFCDPASGLVKNTREFWERGAVHGVREGYELAYQVWNVVGLENAAAMAAHVGEQVCGNRWSEASQRMRQSLLGDAKLALIDGGRFIKRRLADGGVQRLLDPPRREAFPPKMPLAYEKAPYCDPDATMALPIALGLVDARGDLARRTLESIEQLWNQRWNTGGYGRYHVASEPDSPGPWPFATLFVARAYLEAGDSEKVWRALNWMCEIPGGRSGGWFEFYGWRPVPPLPPVGFIPWIWAENLTLLVHHLLGVRPEPARVVIRPRLLDGIQQLAAGVVVGGQRIELRITRAGGPPRATVDGAALPTSGRELVIGRPERPLRIEMAV